MPFDSDEILGFDPYAVDNHSKNIFGTNKPSKSNKKNKNIRITQYDWDTIFGMPNYSFSRMNVKFLFLSDGTFVKFAYGHTPYTHLVHSYNDGESHYVSATALMLKDKIISIEVDRGRDGGPILSYRDEDFWNKFKKEANYDTEVQKLYDKIKYKEVWSEKDLRNENYGYELKPFKIINYRVVNNDEYAVVMDYREIFKDYPYYLIHYNHLMSNNKIDIDLDEWIIDNSKNEYNKIVNIIVCKKLEYKDALKFVEDYCKKNNSDQYEFIVARRKLIRKKQES